MSGIHKEAWRYHVDGPSSICCHCAEPAWVPFCNPGNSTASQSAALSSPMHLHAGLSHSLSHTLVANQHQVGEGDAGGKDMAYPNPNPTI